MEVPVVDENKDVRRFLKIVSGIAFLFLAFQMMRSLRNDGFNLLLVCHLVALLGIVAGCLVDRNGIIAMGAMFYAMIIPFVFIKSLVCEMDYLMAIAVYGNMLIRSLAFLFLWFLIVNKYRIDKAWYFVPVVILISAVIYAGAHRAVFFRIFLTEVVLLTGVAALCFSLAGNDHNLAVPDHRGMHPFLANLIGVMSALLPILAFAFMYRVQPEKMAEWFRPTDDDYFMYYFVNLFTKVGLSILLLLGFFGSLFLYKAFLKNNVSLGRCVVFGLIAALLTSVVVVALYFLLAVVAAFIPLVVFVYFLAGIFSGPAMVYIGTVDGVDFFLL